MSNERDLYLTILDKYSKQDFKKIITNKNTKLSLDNVKSNLNQIKLWSDLSYSIVNEHFNKIDMIKQKPISLLNKAVKTQLNHHIVDFSSSANIVIIDIPLYDLYMYAPNHRNKMLKDIITLAKRHNLIVIWLNSCDNEHNLTLSSDFSLMRVTTDDKIKDFFEVLPFNI